MDIATGTPESHPTPLPLDAAGSPATAPPTPTLGPIAAPTGQQVPARDLTGERLSALAGMEADCRAAQAAGMAAESDRRSHYQHDILPLGSAYGDPLTGMPSIDPPWETPFFAETNQVVPGPA
jgi:hypothetical protein